jgi:hypothetical protein
MKKLIWFLILFLLTVVKSFATNDWFAFGEVLTQFALSLPFAPLLLLIIKKEDKNTSWKWFDWFNAGSYILIGMTALMVLLDAVLKK